MQKQNNETTGPHTETQITVLINLQLDKENYGKSWIKYKLYYG